MDELNLQEKVKTQLIRNRTVRSKFSPHGFFHIEHIRDGKTINEFNIHNGITIEGKNFILDVMFHGTSAAGTWYQGLIDNANYTALDETDTYDDIDQAGNGWDEFKSYTISASTTVRATWDEAAASAKQITSSTQSVFDITASGTVKGIFVVGLGTNANLKGDHAADGKLWSTALFTGGDVAVQNGDQLKVTYTLSC